LTYLHFFSYFLFFVFLKSKQKLRESAIGYW